MVAAGFEIIHNTMIYNKIKNNIFVKDIIKDIPLISSLKKNSSIEHTILQAINNFNPKIQFSSP